MKKIELLMLALSCLTVPAMANDPPASTDVGEAAAAGLLGLRTLSLSQATGAARAAIESCASQKYAVSVAIVDTNGTLKVLLRADGAREYTGEAARQKAYTAASTGLATSQLEPAIRSRPELWSARQIEHFLLLGGGLPFTIGAEVVGGIGISGAPTIEADEACAQAGVDAVSGRSKP